MKLKKEIVFIAGHVGARVARWLARQAELAIERSVQPKTKPMPLSHKDSQSILEQSTRWDTQKSKP